MQSGREEIESIVDIQNNRRGELRRKKIWRIRKIEEINRKETDEGKEKEYKRNDDRI